MKLASSASALQVFDPKPLGKGRDILIGAAGKVTSWAVVTDAFLLPFDGTGREGLGRERRPRWTALITLLLEEVLFLCPSSLVPRGQRAP